MKSITLLGCFILFVVMIHAANITEYAEYARNYGTFSNLIQAQDINQDPSQYFICKVALRESQWIKSLWNCNCGQRWYRWKRSYRCNWCDNSFWSQVNAIKVTYCSYMDWNLQIEKVFQTGKKQSRNWREIACPKGQYAGKIGARFGSQHDTDLGFVGLQMKCQSINFSENSFVQDNYKQFGLSEISKNRQGLFASAFRVKYEPNGKLSGIKWGFEAMPMIVKMSVKYAPVDKLNPQNVIIDSVTVVNSGSKQAQQTVAFTKNHVITNQWNVENSQTFGYEISTSVTVSPLEFASAQTTYSSYSSTTSTFGFNKAVETKFQSTQQTLVIVPPGKRIEVKSLIMQQKVNIPFEATLTFADRFSKKIIGTKVVKGMWEGVMASSVQTVITQSDIQIQSNIIQQTQPQLQTQTPTVQQPTPTQQPTIQQQSTTTTSITQQQPPQAETNTTQQNNTGNV